MYIIQRKTTINKSIQWHFLSIELITHTVGFRGIFKLSPIQNARSIDFVGSIATEFDSLLDDGKTSRHKGSQCHHVLFFSSSFFVCFLQFHFTFFISVIQLCALSILFSLNFLWINSHWSLIIIRFRSKFSEILDWNDFSFRSFIIIIRKRVFMSNSKVNFCRTALHY